jgi:hypothetical protein
VGCHAPREAVRKLVQLGAYEDAKDASWRDSRGTRRRCKVLVGGPAQSAGDVKRAPPPSLTREVAAACKAVSRRVCASPLSPLIFVRLHQGGWEAVCAAGFDRMRRGTRH